MSELGPGHISGNLSCCISSLLTFGVVAISTCTDGASYEPIMAFGAKEDAIETTSNSKSSAALLEEDELAITHSCK